MSGRIDEIKDIVMDIPFLMELDIDLREKLIENMSIEKFKKGSLVFNEGDEGDKIYIVDIGQVAIKKSIDWATGKEFLIDYCQSGDFFGEMAVLENKKRSARAEATEDTQLIVISGNIFLELMKNNPDTFVKLLFSMLKTISNRLRMTHMKLLTFYEIGNIVTGKNPSFDLISTILDTLLLSMNLKYGALLIYNPFSQLLEYAATRGISPVNSFKNGLPVCGVLQKSMEKAIATELNDTFIDDNIRNLLGKEVHPSRVLISPMKLEGKPIGFIIIVKTEDFTPYTNAEILLLSAVAKQIAVVVMTSRTIEETNAREKFQRVHFRDVI